MIIIVVVLVIFILLDIFVVMYLLRSNEKDTSVTSTSTATDNTSTTPKKQKYYDDMFPHNTTYFTKEDQERFYLNRYNKLIDFMYIYSDHNFDPEDVVYSFTPDVINDFDYTIPNYGRSVVNSLGNEVTDFSGYTLYTPSIEIDRDKYNKFPNLWAKELFGDDYDLATNLIKIENFDWIALTEHDIASYKTASIVNRPLLFTKYGKVTAYSDMFSTEFDNCISEYMYSFSDEE